MATQIITAGGIYNNPAGSIVVGGSPTTNVVANFTSVGNHSLGLNDNQNRSRSVATGLNGISFSQLIDDYQKVVDITPANQVVKKDVNTQSTVYADRNNNDGMPVANGSNGYVTAYWTFDYRLAADAPFEGVVTTMLSPTPTGYSLGVDNAAESPGYAIKFNSIIATGVV